VNNQLTAFLSHWGDAAYTSVGIFWMALWAFVLGYISSSVIQIFVTERRMQRAMGDDGSKSVLLAAFFGFISSSCSFAALATAKSLFKKGASFVSSIAFLLASTNLVIELGIIIFVFLGWQFVVGNYVGGILLILFSWALIRIIRPSGLIREARERLGQTNTSDISEKGLVEKLRSEESWAKVGKQYVMEWKMVWKDVTVGFTLAGIVAIFVPDTFFQALFVQTGEGQTSFGFFTLLQHVVIGPVAAFLTFIGSMGNIPLSALLYGKGVSFAGVMAFIFSDLVVFPVLRINARYYGWRMSLFILFLLFTSLIAASLVLHYGFQVLDLLPAASDMSLSEMEHFKVDYTFFLNLAFIILSGVLVYLGPIRGKDVKYHKEMAPKSPLLERVLKWLAWICYMWLIVGIILKLFLGS
jgi:uncharacterized membrane protein YraQ (UPF0718 family)